MSQLTNVYRIGVICAIFHIDNTSRELGAILAAAHRNCAAGKRPVGKRAAPRDVALGRPGVQTQSDKVAVRMGVGADGRSGSKRHCLAPQRHAGAASRRVVANCDALGLGAGQFPDADGPVRIGISVCVLANADVVVACDVGAGTTPKCHVLVTLNPTAGTIPHCYVELTLDVLAGLIANGNIMRLVTRQKLTRILTSGTPD